MSGMSLHPYTKGVPIGRQISIFWFVLGIFWLFCFGGFIFGWCLVFVLFDGDFITAFWPATVHFWWPLNLRTAMYMHQLTLHPNLKHAIERVERPGGSHEGVGRKTMTSSSIVWAARGQSAWKSTSLRHQFHALVWTPVASFHFTWPKHSWIHLLASAGTAPVQTKKTLSHLDLSNKHLLDRSQRGIPVMKKRLGRTRLREAVEPRRFKQLQTASMRNTLSPMFSMGVFTF